MTLKEIAKLAGVSPACVSLVRNGRPGVGVSVRQKVQNLLYEHGYSYKDYEPDDVIMGSAAQRLLKLTYCIRLLKYRKHAMLVDGNEGFVSSIIDAIDIEARAQGFHMIMSTCSPENQQEVIEAVCKTPMDGVILIATEMEQRDFELLRSLPGPAVVVDSDFVDAHYGVPYHSVTMDNREIAQFAVDRLLTLGHRRIGFLRSCVDTGNFLSRYHGYLNALRRAGLSADPALTYALRPSMHESFEDMRGQLMQGMPLPTAFLAANDTIAIGAIKALKECGLRVPADISVFGVDDIPFGRIQNPPLTTMGISCKEIGQWAVRLLINNLREQTMPTCKMHISATFVDRGSIGPCPAKARTPSSS